LGVEKELEKSRGLIGAGFDETGAEPRVTLSGESTDDLDIGTGSSANAPAIKTLSGIQNPLRGLISGGFRTRRFAALLIILLVVFGAGFYLLLALKWRPATPFQSMQVRRFTTSGKATHATISPDGKYVVHVLREAGKQSLLVRQVSESNNIEIVPPADVTYQGLTFSRDGAHVYYVLQKEQNNPISMLYQVPTLGGIPRKILKDIDSAIAVSPNDKQLAFVRRNRGLPEDALIITDIDGSNERKLASRKGADFFGIGGPAWSPDGRVIATAAGSNAGRRHMYVAEINVADGKEKPISEQRWASVGRVSWVRDGSSTGRGLIFSATEQGSTMAQIWFLPYPKGAAQKITNDLNDYRDLNLTDDATALVTAQFEARVEVWISTLPAGGDRQITDGLGQYNGVNGLTWIPKGNQAGRLVYVSRPYGSQDLWLMDQDGKNQRPLTTEPRADRYPAVTPDGRYIAFVSTRTGNSHIYRYDLISGEQKQLTSGESEEFPTVSADGKWVIYAATESTKHTLWKVSIDGGEPVRLTDKLSTWPIASPDGQKIACWYRAEPGANWQIAVIPITGGNPEKVFDVPANADTPIPTRWMPDGSGISFVATQNGVSNIWSQPLAGGAPRQITNFSFDQISWFDWSMDGKKLACTRGKMLSDIVLITESKP
jgi:Tol biopolymer transport system component